jgi:hypothetical protein
MGEALHVAGLRDDAGGGFGKLEEITGKTIHSVRFNCQMTA